MLSGRAPGVLTSASDVSQQTLSAPASGGDAWTFGPFRVDAAAQTLTRDGVELPVKPKAFALLVLLLRHRDRVVDKREVIDTLWAGRVVEEGNLTQNVYELRALLDDQRPYRWIATVARRGYRFVGPAVHRPAVARDVRSLAVLPFESLGADDDESLRFGIAEAITGALAARGTRVTVRPAGAARGLRGGVADPVSAARRLQVDAVVGGSIQRAGDRLRVTARLSDSVDGSVRWSRRFDGALDRIFDFQDAIADGIADAVAIEAGGTARAQSIDAEGYLAFLRGRHHWHQWTPAGWRHAEADLRDAIARAPSHAPSHAWLAATHAVQGMFGLRRAGEAFALARAAVDRALELDPALPEAHEFRGAIALWRDWDWPEAERWIRAAVRLNPGGAGHRHLLALLYAHVGRTDEALAEMQAALRVDPLSSIANTDHAWLHYYARRHDEALAHARATLRLDPNFAHARLVLGLVLVALGRADEGLVELRTAGALAGREPRADPWLGYGLARAGDQDTANAILGELEARGRAEFVEPTWPARVCAGLGRVDAAYEWLERAWAERSRDLITLQVDATWDGLRDDTRWRGPRPLRDPRPPGDRAALGSSDAPRFAGPPSAHTSGAMRAP
jgi:DNA-binding winged helix-turn-helix (wHTH) protein/tetratricopeptide (TPR) repeat protein